MDSLGFFSVLLEYSSKMRLEVLRVDMFENSLIFLRNYGDIFDNNHNERVVLAEKKFIYL